MLLPYYFIIKKRTRHYIYPIIKFDFLMPFAVSLLWLIVGCISDANVKSMSNLVELFVLGKIWAATWLVRLAAICILRRKSEVVCLCSDMFVVLLTLLFAVIFPTLPE
jgi:hypothetical protein